MFSRWSTFVRVLHLFITSEINGHGMAVKLAVIASKLTLGRPYNDWVPEIISEPSAVYTRGLRM